MTTHSQVSFNEAIEILSHLINIDLEKNFDILQLNLPNHSLNWVDESSSLIQMKTIKFIYQTIYNYMREVYGDDHQLIKDPATIEGIKSIMILVGDSAKKLEKLTALFDQQVDIQELKEYKQLQTFYASKISKQVEQELMGEWVFGILKKNPIISLEEQINPLFKATEVNHVFIDLDSVKKDLDYELFFIRKQDGSRFFNPRLVRNLKLVCDFGGFQPDHIELGLDPLSEWIDRMLQAGAMQIIKKIAPYTSHYYQTSKRYKNLDIVQSLNKALLALMMSSHETNLSKYSPVKTCMEYYLDFQAFLRQSMHSNTFQRWLAYPPGASNEAAISIIELVQAICNAIFSQQNLLSEIHPQIQEFIRKNQGEEVVEGRNSKKQENLYGEMSRWTKKFLSGPLHKVLDVLEEGSCHTFDPVFQSNIPYKIFDMIWDENRISNLRIPSPTIQEFIDRASIVEEFKAFIRFLSVQGMPKKHLVFNLQNRTTWLEHARCVALEELQNNEDLNKSLCVVTLANDTDFKNQEPPYSEINQSAVFFQVFKEHLFGSQSGFYFPKNISSEKLEDFVDAALPAIHQIFFSGKNVLSTEQRIDFIEIFYLFLQLKLIELVKPSSFSLTCKDGLDLGISMSAGLFTMLTFIIEGKFQKHDIEFLHTLLYGPIFINRERLMISKHFQRFINYLKITENAIEERGYDQFKKLIQERLDPCFETSLFKVRVILPN